MRALTSSPRFQFWLSCLLVFIGVEAIVRLSIAGWIVLTKDGYIGDLLLALPAGIIEDAGMGVLLGLPFLMGLYLFPNFLARPTPKFLAHVLLLSMLAFLVFIAVAELFFWNEFESRLNGIAYFYLIFPHEVTRNLHESFPLHLILPPIAITAGYMYWRMRAKLSAALTHVPAKEALGKERRTALMAVPVAAMLGLAPVYYGPFYSSPLREANETALNGIHGFFKAVLTNDSDYDGLYLTLPQGEALRITRDLVAQDNTTFIDPQDTLSLLRHVDNGDAGKALNVILVLEESFGTIYVDGVDNPGPESISPHLVRLGAEGMFFTNIYATGNRTVRGLEGILTSFPPIPGISTARRPGSQGMNSLPRAFEKLGYDSLFLYGGRGIFDNMGAFWEGIGFDRVLDQSDIAEIPFDTAWGAADEYLFTEALTRMDTHYAENKDGKPLFFSLLTVSNHRPYTYPEGRISKDPGEKRRQNAATYADWAFGDFVERAREKPWFKDTVFVFVGDHGPRIYGSAKVPVPSYRIPMLFYAPGHIKPQQVENLGSYMDLGPTLLGVLGLSHDSPFFGIDLTREGKEDAKRRVIMEHNYSVAYGDGENVAAIGPAKDSVGYTMKIGPHELEATRVVDENLLKKTIAMIQTAHKMFYGRCYHDMEPTGEDQGTADVACTVPGQTLANAP